MSRAVLLGTNAYPYLIRYWYELFVANWQDEVDKVYVAISKAEHESSWGYIRALLNAHPKIQVYETNTNWPVSLNQVAQQVQEDYIFVPHDDTLITKPGVVDGYFKIVESTGKVVTPVTSIVRPIDLVAELMSNKWGRKVPFVAENGESAFSFYCNMFFMPKSLFDKTSKDFGEFRLSPGEYSPLLNWTSKITEIASDTNFKLCLELLEAGAEFHAIPRIEPGTLYTLDDPLGAMTDYLKTHKDAGWIHLQTMAYHIYGLYRDLGVQEALEEQVGGKVPLSIENERAMFEVPSYRWSMIFKLAWLFEFMRVGDYTGMQKYHDHAQKEIKKVIKVIGLPITLIRQLQREYKKFVWGGK